jgi:hypothetical protein
LQPAAEDSVRRNPTLQQSAGIAGNFGGSLLSPYDGDSIAGLTLID